jgi:hypothetical protein
MGQVAQAEVIVVEDSGSNTRRRALLCTAVVLWLSIIMGIVVGTKDNTSPDTTTRLTTLSDMFVKYKVSIQALQDTSSPQYLALAWMAGSNDSTDLQSILSDDKLVERFASFFPSATAS